MALVPSAVLTSNGIRQCSKWHCNLERMENMNYCSPECLARAAAEEHLFRLPVIKYGTNQAQHVLYFEKVFAARQLGIPTGIPVVEFNFLSVPPWFHQPAGNLVNDLEPGEMMREWAFLYPAIVIPYQGGLENKWRVYSMGKRVSNNVRLMRWNQDPQPDGGRWKVQMYHRENHLAAEGPPASLVFMRYTLA